MVNEQPAQTILDDSVMTYNREIVKLENQQIVDFINRYKWQMESTATGLRYMVYKSGKGAKPSFGSSVTIYYTAKLLTGDLIFRSDSINPVTFVIGRRNVTSGLEEGVMLMHQGDRAKLIVPSHLAFGLLGDLDKIPARAVICYDIALMRVSNKN
jgi:FKBP-type peptidyl-prolyl cis-trans isomerase